MHEMSIALSMIKLAEQSALEARGSKILQIDLEIGELAGVLTDALAFSMDVVVQGTLADTAKINIHTVQGAARCTSCGKTFHLAQLWAVCPHCESLRYEILAGKELKIKTIDIE